MERERGREGDRERSFFEIIALFWQYSTMKLRPTWRFILRLLLITSILVIPLMATDQLRHLIMDFPGTVCPLISRTV